MGEKVPLRWLKFEEAKEATTEPMISLNEVFDNCFYFLQRKKYGIIFPVQLRFVICDLHSNRLIQDELPFTNPF